MIDLHGRSVAANVLSRVVPSVFRLERNGEHETGSFILRPNRPDDPRKLRLVWSASSELSLKDEWIVAPASLSYLKSGDIVSISDDARFINVLWRGNSATNSLLLTERCDNYCLMCSQPPRKRNDEWLLDQAFDVISLMPRDAVEIGLTGGEPTLYGDRFVELIRHITSQLPDTSLHILSNGRRFNDWGFANRYSEVTGRNTMIGIPVYGSESTLHDLVVQAKGAFDETINGILNLGELGQAIEIRVVIHALTAPRIVEIAEFISRNLTFVDQVALMGLEMMGLARRNIDEVWVEPRSYAEELAEAVQLLHAQGLKVHVYNHQLCTLHPDIWDFSVKSISDWKTEYDEICSECDVIDRCGGFFHSAKYGSSDLITPLSRDGSPKNHQIKSSAEGSHKVWKRRRIPVTSVFTE